MAMRDSNDDIFDEDADENLLHQKEWNKMKLQILKEGFRTGVSEGEELSLQEGFNFGYNQIVKLSYNLGKLRGRISALLTLNQLGDIVFTSGETTDHDFDSRKITDPIFTTRETTDSGFTSRETTDSGFTSRETTDSGFTSRENTCEELKAILQDVTNFENKLKKSVTAKCSEIATVDSSTSGDVSVCSCDRLDHCPVCYGDSREMVTDLGLDDLGVNRVPDNQNSADTNIASAESSTKLCLEQITKCYCQILDEAKSMLDEYEERVAKIVKENVGVQ